MPTYQVTLRKSLWTTLTVEADSEEGAVERALEDAPGGICAQCSGWGRGYSVDEDEWDLPDEEEGEKFVRLSEVESTDG